MELLEIIAYNDYSTAVELAKTYSFIDRNTDLVGFYANEYDLPFSPTLLRFHSTVLQNLFFFNIPLSVQLQYHSDVYVFPVALYLAAITGNIPFLVQFKEKIRVNEKTTLNSILYLLGNEQAFPEEVESFNLEGCLEIIDLCGNIDSVIKERILDNNGAFYTYVIMKSRKLELKELIEEIPSNKLANLSEEIAEGIAKSGDRKILDDLPKNFPFVKQDLLPNLCHNFPLNLKTAEQVRDYEGEIRDRVYEIFYDAFDGGGVFHSSESLQEIITILKDEIKTREGETEANENLDYYFYYDTPFEERIKCLELVASDRLQDVLIRVIATILKRSEEIHLFEDYVMEYVRRYGIASLPRIQSSLKFYLKYNISL